MLYAMMEVFLIKYSNLHICIAAHLHIREYGVY